MERISLLDDNLVKYTDTRIVLKEVNSGGEAELTCKLSNPAITFLKLEDKKLKYFSCDNCADNIVFEKIGEDQWKLHVIEFKRSVGSKEWAKIKKQFIGAILNSWALAGFLGINHFSEIKCYTAFVRDKLVAKRNPNPVTLRIQTGKKVDNPYLDWKKDEIKIDIGKVYHLKHEKINLSLEKKNDKDVGISEIDL